MAGCRIRVWDLGLSAEDLGFWGPIWWGYKDSSILGYILESPLYWNYQIQLGVRPWLKLHFASSSKSFADALAHFWESGCFALWALEVIVLGSKEQPAADH